LQQPNTKLSKYLDRDLDYKIHKKVMDLHYYDKADDVPDTMNEDITGNLSKKLYVTTQVWNEMFKESPLMNVELVPYYSSDLQSAFLLNAAMADKGFNHKATQDGDKWTVGYHMEPLAPQSPQSLVIHESLCRAACFAALAALDDKVKKDILIKGLKGTVENG